MAKRFTIICLFLLAIAGVKAQTTYCYHQYKLYDENDIPKPIDNYEYLTFYGDWMYPTEKDGSYRKGLYDGKPLKQLYKYEKIVDGVLMYSSWDERANKSHYELFLIGRSSYFSYYLVSKDKKEINYVFKGWYGSDGTVFINPYTICLEHCPFENCDKTDIPTMKH